MERANRNRVGLLAEMLLVMLARVVAKLGAPVR